MPRVTRISGSHRLAYACLAPRPCCGCSLGRRAASGRRVDRRRVENNAARLVDSLVFDLPSISTALREAQRASAEQQSA
jgi:hypothetical protein